MTATFTDTVTPLSELGYARHSHFDHRQTAPEGAKGLTIPRIFSRPDVHPYDEVAWELRTIDQKHWETKETVYHQKDVEFPTSWSINASTIVATKYFRGHEDHGNKEHSLKQLIDRVVGSYRKAGDEHGYFATSEDAVVFADELTWLLLHQYFSFNSPVWFNVGTDAPQQVSACFILAVEDSMDSILNWYREEGLIFKGGSGAGLNLSRIRSSKELLSSGGTASGPVSFMRGADASAGTIKSGGATRRAAKMVVLDVDHPDILEFVNSKAHEEEKIRALAKAGFKMGVGGADMFSVQYQNANNSVRVNDEFMHAEEDGKTYNLIARGSRSGRGAGEVLEEIDAASLWNRMAEAAWECADPGIQYDGTINGWHTTPESGRITASNPCSEYMSLDNSSCNLASLNLLKFRREDGKFDVQRFIRATELVFTAMDISICFADFPTAAIGRTTREFRQLGIGYANLGALLMASGLAYDSSEGRGLAAAITALMTGVSYRRSAELAGVVGPYVGYAMNAEGHARVMRMHEAAAQYLTHEADNDLLPEQARNGLNTAVVTSLAVHVAEAACAEWFDANRLGESNGWRNAQASLLAPTGTIGFMMDCDTTGIEPDFSLLKGKKMVGGGEMVIVNQTITPALQQLGYTAETVEAVVEFIQINGHVVNAPGLRPEHYDVFDCAVGKRAIEPMGHVRMMAATQPFLSGAISKTVNMPEAATVEDVREIHLQGWKLGLKALAIYRNNCKVGQPLSDAREKSAGGVVENKPVRRKLPQSRPGNIRSFSVGAFEGYLIWGVYDDGQLGEVFVKGAKQGTILAGLLDAFSIEFSMGRQYHVPLEVVLSKYIGMSFEPAGMTDDPELRIASSIMDYLARRLALDFLPFDIRAGLNVYTSEERTRQQESGSYQSPAAAGEAEAADLVAPALPLQVNTDSKQGSVGGVFSPVKTMDTEVCASCGSPMRPAGSCFVCESCGTTSGCS
jgi:ribonucleoside-diphosphate reductase alpha chain